MKKSFLFICCTLLVLLSMAQTTGVVLHKDSRIDVLLKKQHDINSLATKKNGRGQYRGFRVMAMNTSDRDLAYKTKAQLLSRFPEFQVYVSYQAPFFKLKIGDFIARNDAEDLRKRVATMMTQGVYIVPDLVILKADDEERLINEN